MQEIYTRPFGNPCDEQNLDRNGCCREPWPIRPNFIPVARGSSITLHYDLNKAALKFEEIYQITFTFKRDKSVVYYPMYNQAGVMDINKYNFDKEKNIINFTLSKNETVNYSEGDCLEVETAIDTTTGKTILEKQPSIKITASTYGDILEVINGENVNSHLRGSYWYTGKGIDDASIKADLAAREGREKVYPLSGDLYLCTEAKNTGRIFQLGNDGVWTEKAYIQGGASDHAGVDQIISGGFVTKEMADESADDNITQDQIGTLYFKIKC